MIPHFYKRFLGFKTNLDRKLKYMCMCFSISSVFCYDYLIRRLIDTSSHTWCGLFVLSSSKYCNSSNAFYIDTSIRQLITSIQAYAQSAIPISEPFNGTRGFYTKFQGQPSTTESR